LAGGMITQTGAITQQAAAGTATFTATGGNNITLTNAGNVFTGGLVLSSNNALVSAPTVTLNAETLAGNLTIITTTSRAPARLPQWHPDHRAADQYHERAVPGGGRAGARREATRNSHGSAAIPAAS